MAEAPDAYETLTERDAVEVMEELLPAQSHSYVLGLKLKLEPHVVEAIHSKDLSPDKYLLQVIMEFTRQTEPRPTWRVIVKALRSPAVRLPALAQKVEAAHPPRPHSSRDVVPATTAATESAATGTTAAAAAAAAAAGDEVKSKPSSQPTTASATVQDSHSTSGSVEAVEAEITGLHKRFNSIKYLTIQALDKCCIAVMTVVYILTNIRTVQEHRVFLKEKYKALRQCEDHLELFGSLNFYWNFLAPDLLDHLTTELAKKHKAFHTITAEMALYKKDLQEFRKRTTLELFCLAESRPLEEDPPPGFRKMVVRFDWPPIPTLEDVEMFRRQYARSYDLQTCAMMLSSIGTGSFTVTWFVPVSVVELLRKKRALAVFKEFSVTRLEIHTSTVVCIYQTSVQRPQMALTSDSPATTISTAVKREPVPEEDYRFAEQPSDDFFCPVTMGLLLQPHLTSCCGNHLSQEAVARIGGEGGACPFCKKQNWSTMLNRHFQRQVKSLRVFCHYKDRGCGWQGELAALPHHIQSCPMSGGPLMTELLKLSVYSEREIVSGAERTTASGAGPPPTRSLFTVQCCQKKKAPDVRGMLRGSATTDGRFAYFTPYNSTSVYQHECNTEKWEELPSCPYHDSGLAVINRELTAVGGGDGGRCTNKLLTLRQRKWVEEYPPMTTARFDPAVVSTSDGDHLIVTGGYDALCSAAVELLQVKTRNWYRISYLPQPFSLPSATICGNQLNVIGVDSNGYSCSLQALPSSDQPITSPLTLSWNPLPTLPVTQSTAATLCGQLVIIGGRRSGSSVDSIHQLVEGQWVKIGSMASDRRLCLVASPSPDKFIIVGGVSALHYNTVEECVVVTE